MDGELLHESAQGFTWQAQEASAEGHEVVAANAEMIALHISHVGYGRAAELKGGVGGEFLRTPGKHDRSGEVMGLDDVAAGSMMARELEATVQDGVEAANREGVEQEGGQLESELEQAPAAGSDQSKRSGQSKGSAAGASATAPRTRAAAKRWAKTAGGDVGETGETGRASKRPRKSRS